MTAISTFTWLDGEDFFDRTVKWVRYYQEIKAEIGFDEMYLFDNGSRPETISRLISAIGVPAGVVVHSYTLTLPRRGHTDYPYVWRYLWDLPSLFEHHDKIISITEDAFILSSKLAGYVKDLTSGHTALWCPMHNIPEDNIHVLCKDGFPAYTQWVKDTYGKACGSAEVERLIPFTYVEKGFIGDRYGEQAHREQQPDMDYYAQCKLDTQVSYNMKR